MNDEIRYDRIHACLDGDGSPGDLTPAERRELETMRAAIHESLASLDEAPAPDVTHAVMERIERLESEERAVETAGEATAGVWDALERAVRWIWTPKPVRVRPAWALAGLAVLALGAGLLPLGTPDAPAGPLADATAPDTDATAPDAATASAATAAPDRPDDGAVLWVRFDLEAPDASSVAVAGTFNGWEPDHELTETRPGRWSALIPLRPGVHEYSFVVDGERWVTDPDAPRVDDGFGGTNSRLGLLIPENGRTL